LELFSFIRLTYLHYNPYRQKPQIIAQDRRARSMMFVWICFSVRKKYLLALRRSAPCFFTILVKVANSIETGRCDSLRSNFGTECRSFETLCLRLSPNRLSTSPLLNV